MTDTTKERAQFEEWVRQSGDYVCDFRLKQAGDEYLLHYMQQIWKVWMARAEQSTETPPHTNPPVCCEITMNRGHSKWHCFKCGYEFEASSPASTKGFQQACYECDGDGCAKCDPIGTIRKVCNGEIQVDWEEDGEGVLRYIESILPVAEAPRPVGTPEKGGL